MTAIFSLISLISSLVSWLHERQLINQAQAAATAAHLEAQADALRKATEAREKVRMDAAGNPDSVMQPDDFTRKD
jgi:hypothetical protein